MDNLDKLIKSLQDLKEELSKNVNQSYGNAPNMAKDEIKPDKGYGKITIKDSPQPKDKENPHGKVIFKEELTCAENGQWNIVEKAARKSSISQQPVVKKPTKSEHAAASENSAHRLNSEDHPSKLSHSDVKRLVKEDMEKDSANPKLAPKDVKVKQLQQQIDAGTYKPDAGKIAGAMLQHPEKPIKKEEE